MKQRVIGTVVLLVILAVLYIFTGNVTLGTGSNNTAVPTFDSSDRDFKDLKIN